MKYYLCVFTLIFGVYAEAQSMDWNQLSPLKVEERSGDPLRVIEPTSVILGRDLVLKIREDKRSPEEILQELMNFEPQLSRDLILSAGAYVNTLKEPLDEFCRGEADYNNIKYTLVEHAAIPLEVLSPMHESYKQELRSISQDERGQEFFSEEARLFQERRNNCDAALKMIAMENKAKKLSPGRYDRLIDLNHKVSSPEGSFPRIQYAINGFTQFVYGELFGLEDDRLGLLLKTVHQALNDWRDERVKSDVPLKKSWIKTAEEASLNAGFTPRETLLALAYSNRNMPSLDVHYAHNPKKSLMLEVYFWKIKALRDEVSRKFLPEVFPNRIFKKNPGVYHYLTAAFLACEVKLNGYSGFMARSLAIASKAGYKGQKLFTYIFDPNNKNRSIKGIVATAKKQALNEGIEAGNYGGKYGTSLCKRPSFFGAKI